MEEQNSGLAGLADINGGKLYYETAGNGPCLILAHAGIADRRMWDDQFFAFAQHYRVVRFDFWGYGESTIATDFFFLQDDLYQLLKHLAVDQAHFIGCSLGGRVVIDLALAHPETVNSLVVVGSGLSGYRFGGEAFVHYAEQIIAAREKEDDEGEIELKLQFWVDGQGRDRDQVNPQVRKRARQMLSGRPGARGEGRQMEPPAIGRLKEIHVPTLIVIGEQDEANVTIIADLLASNIPGAQKTILPNTAHLANMEEPERFNRIVLNFLKSLQT